MTSSGIKTEGRGEVTEIESLANRVRELGQSVDLWNVAMLWGLGWLQSPQL
jgi:hypothetical protein